MQYAVKRIQCFMPVHKYGIIEPVFTSGKVSYTTLERDGFELSLAQLYLREQFSESPSEFVLYFQQRHYNLT